jgi:hypothetical protein
VVAQAVVAVAPAPAREAAMAVFRCWRQDAQGSRVGLQGDKGSGKAGLGELEMGEVPSDRS